MNENERKAFVRGFQKGCLIMIKSPLYVAANILIILLATAKNIWLLPTLLILVGIWAWVYYHILLDPNED